jgi:hypothetical protein
LNIYLSFAIQTTIISNLSILILQICLTHRGWVNYLITCLQSDKRLYFNTDIFDYKNWIFAFINNLIIGILKLEIAILGFTEINTTEKWKIWGEFMIMEDYYKFNLHLVDVALKFSGLYLEFVRGFIVIPIACWVQLGITNFNTIHLYVRDIKTVNPESL